MSVYLHDIPLEQALARLDEALQQAGLGGVLGKERLRLEDSLLGRVLAEPVWAKRSSPHYHAAAMDGFAVRAADTAGAMPTAPKTLVCSEQAVYVDTGDAMPPDCDAVVMIEQVEPLDADGKISSTPRQPAAIRIRAALPPWSHVRPMGEDVVATQLVLPAGHILRAVDLGAIAASGHAEVVVARRPKVAVLPTGSELVPVGHAARAGEIIEFNSLVLAAQVRDWGGLPTRYPITPDDFEQIQARVAEAAAQHDLVLLNAGSSAGSEDFSARVVASLGEVLVHGVAVRPGHPVILGMLDAGKERRVPVIGVPGYPVSAALTGEIFVQRLLARWLGRLPGVPQVLPAQITRKLVSPPGDQDYVRVAVGKVGERWLAAPLARGAGVITSLVRADGIVVVPSGSQGLPAGETVAVRLYRPLSELEGVIFAIGSHDITLDVLAGMLALRGRRLNSSNVGSMGGLMALRRGQAHLAGSHLLDPQSGTYNLPDIARMLPDLPVTVMALVGRQQGLIVPSGNPKNICQLEDLAREDVRMVNRQRGAGTRVLLDYHLEQLGISAEQVAGYDREEYTHLAVAAAVASGRADCGLGIAAAAQALELDFVPLFQERYDLVIPTIFYRDRLLEPLLELIAGREFRNSVAALPGYDVSLMGKIMAET